MKTTIDIADGLLVEAKKAARENQTTLRALVEEGLRSVLKKRCKPVEFQLRDASVKGQGLHPDLDEGSWEKIRGKIYRGRGA
ncbi:MAG TPA: DUF2191 domain-containing protein [Acidobacteriota bacterium]|nr:DUF2191 domain-containing protein [Acidobacteriota bacterium]